MDIAKKYHVILCDDVRNEVGNKLQSWAFTARNCGWASFRQ